VSPLVGKKSIFWTSEQTKYPACWPASNKIPGTLASEQTKYPARWPASNKIPGTLASEQTKYPARWPVSKQNTWHAGQRAVLLVKISTHYN